MFEPLSPHFQDLASGPEDVSLDELRDLIQQGMESPEIPAVDAFDQLRKHAQALAHGAE